MLALTFQVGPERLALDVGRIHEVVPRVRLAPAAGGPAWVAGVFVYRGRVVPVLDLYKFTGAGECPLHLSSRIILVPDPAGGGDLVGLLATHVADVREVVATPAVGAGPIPGLGRVVADGSGVLRILDADHLFATLGPGGGP